MFSALVSALIILPLISAKTHEVIVGGPGVLTYSPEYVNADVGDYVRFIFKQSNHTVTQSTFDYPCTALTNGFDSGFVPVPDSQTTDFPYYDYEVISKDPVWAYCRQGNHCVLGMRFAINPGDYWTEYKNKDWFETTDWKVVVGGDAGNVYTPSIVKAKKGDTITFEFKQKNHTVTQSSFDNPCVKIADGFDSGFKPVPPEQTTGFPTWTWTVTDDTKPIWAYCRQTGHCGQGMVFAVNADEQQYLTFQNTAIRINGTAPTVTSVVPLPTVVDPPVTTPTVSEDPHLYSAKFKF